MRSRVASYVGLLVTIPCLAAGVLRTPRARDARESAAVRIDAPRVAGPEDRAPAADSSSVFDTDADAPVDLYGNPVTDAVADYRLDSAGSLYESHSPQTEIPKLASPKS
jgi:hypothetical protein